MKRSITNYSHDFAIIIISFSIMLNATSIDLSTALAISMLIFLFIDPFIAIVISIFPLLFIFIFHATSIVLFALTAIFASCSILIDAFFVTLISLDAFYFPTHDVFSILIIYAFFALTIFHGVFSLILICVVSPHAIDFFSVLPIFLDVFCFTILYFSSLLLVFFILASVDASLLIIFSFFLPSRDSHLTFFYSPIAVDFAYLAPIDSYLLATSASFLVLFAPLTLYFLIFSVASLPHACVGVSSNLRFFFPILFYSTHALCVFFITVDVFLRVLLSSFILAIDAFLHFICFIVILLCVLMIAFFLINDVIFIAFISVIFFISLILICFLPIIGFCVLCGVLSIVFLSTQLVFVPFIVFIFPSSLGSASSSIIIVLCFSTIACLFAYSRLLAFFSPLPLRYLSLYVNQPTFSIFACFAVFSIFPRSFSSPHLLQVFFVFSFLPLLNESLLLAYVFLALLHLTSIFPFMFLAIWLFAPEIVFLPALIYISPPFRFFTIFPSHLCVFAFLSHIASFD